MADALKPGAGKPAAKKGDQVVGLDTHILMVPSPAGPVPTPTPMPFSGQLSDSLSPDVKVENQPLAVVGSVAICALEELSPPDLLERLRGYGINSPEERAHRHQRWAQEFSRDPSLKRTLRVLVKHRKQMFGARMATRSTTPEKPTSRPAPMPVKAPSVRVIESNT